MKKNITLLFFGSFFLLGCRGQQSKFSGNIEKTIQVATNGIPRDFYLKLKGEVSGQALDAARPGVEMDRVK